MAEQLHITHRADYLRGRKDGETAVLTGGAYLPGELRILHGDTDGRKAYRLGYADGWAEANPCDNGTCDHLAHRYTCARCGETFPAGITGHTDDNPCAA